MIDDPSGGHDRETSDPFPSDEPPWHQPYPSGTVTGGVLASIFFPVVSLIAALMLQGREANPVRRDALRRWAILSGGLIAAQVLIAVIFFASIASSFNNGVDRSGPCQGGPELGVGAVPDANGNAVFPCVFGGSVTVNFSETGDELDE